MIKPQIIEGGLSVDDRGQISFCNGFTCHGIKRFYTVSNHQSYFVRAFHGHKREHKYVMATQGTARVVAVAINDWDAPSPVCSIYKYILSANKPTMLYIPAGYANGWMNLTVDTQLIFFSSATLEESQEDDYRFPSNYWAGVWEVEQR